MGDVVSTGAIVRKIPEKMKANGVKVVPKTPEVIILTVIQITVIVYHSIKGAFLTGSKGPCHSSPPTSHSIQGIQ